MLEATDEMKTHMFLKSDRANSTAYRPEGVIAVLPVYPAKN